MDEFRLLFSAEGHWLTQDSASPLFGWDMTAVRASGKRHGVPDSDICGCLFFHVKDEFLRFATRVKDGNINIFVTPFDACGISQTIPLGLFLPFHANCFDRIETSNMADYIGVERVLRDWGPLLKKTNKYATLLVYFMNWPIGQPSAAIDHRKLHKNLFLRTGSVLVSLSYLCQ